MAWKQHSTFLGGSEKNILIAQGIDFNYNNPGGQPSAYPRIVRNEMNGGYTKVLPLLDGIYSTVIVRDILEFLKHRGQRQITDAVLLKKIIMFLADNIGSTVSASSIGNILVNEGLLDDNRKTKPSTHTVQAYVDALLESYFSTILSKFLCFLYTHPTHSAL